MDKFKGTPSRKNKWSVKGEIMKQKHRNFQNKFKKVLKRTASTHDTEELVPVTFKRVSKKLSNIVEVKTVKESLTSFGNKKKKKNKQIIQLKTESDLNDNKLVSEKMRNNSSDNSCEKYKERISGPKIKKKKSKCLSDVKGVSYKENIRNFNESDNTIKYSTSEFVIQSNIEILPLTVELDCRNKSIKVPPMFQSGNLKEVASNNEDALELEIKVFYESISKELDMCASSDTLTNNALNIDNNYNNDKSISKDFEMCASSDIQIVGLTNNILNIDNNYKNDHESISKGLEMCASSDIETVVELTNNTLNIDNNYKNDHESISKDLEMCASSDIETVELTNNTLNINDNHKNDQDPCEESHEDSLLVQEINENYTPERKPLPVVMYKLPNCEKIILLMKYPGRISFKGKLTITVLSGCVEILGCVMSVNAHRTLTVYSPKGSSMMTIETCSSIPSNSLDNEVLNKILHTLNIELSKEFITNIGKQDCILMLEEPPSSLFENFLKTFPSALQLFSISESKKFFSPFKSSLFREAERTLKCLFHVYKEDNRNYRLLIKGKQWDEISNDINSTSRNDSVCTIICGGKGVGKSTFLRFLINRALPVHGEVLCLDFDPGQVEFTVPGCLSAVIVRKPLLGPNFTHTTTPECMVFLGEVNISQCPTKYIQSAQYIINFCKSNSNLKKIPWIVNTMGFAKGVGVDLTTSLIRMLKPQHVVQIQSPKSDVNFAELLTPHNVLQYHSSFHKISSELLQYSFHEIDSMATLGINTERESPWGLGAAQLRETMVMSYISQMVQAPNFSLTEVVPFRTSLSRMTLCVCHATVPYAQILSAMNGNFVALCSYKGNNALVPDDPELPQVLGYHPVCPCFGFGIVRGIDPIEKKLFVITPLPEVVLREVNCLMMGAITLPTYVYINSSGISGQVPYVATGPGQPTSKVPRRMFRPPSHAYRNQNYDFD